MLTRSKKQSLVKQPNASSNMKRLCINLYRNELDKYRTCNGFFRTTSATIKTRSVENLVRTSSGIFVEAENTNQAGSGINISFVVTKNKKHHPKLCSAEKFGFEVLKLRDYRPKFHEGGANGWMTTNTQPWVPTYSYLLAKIH